MHEDLDKLERELDAALAAWSERLDVEPSEAAVARTQEAVRHELNEAWLADQPIPQPTMASLDNIKSAVRAELRKVKWQTRLWRWSPVAAAAMIAFGVGLFHHVRTDVKTTSLTNGVDQFVLVANVVFAEDPALTAIEKELEALEQSIDQFSLTGDFYQSDLDRLGDEMDAFESTLDRMSQASGDRQGVFG